MNIALNRKATADSREATRKTNDQFEALTLDSAFSEAVRELAEKSIDQTREVYERSKNALEAAADTMARSFDALGQGAAALNRKVIEIAHENVSSGFELAKSWPRPRPSPRWWKCRRPIGASTSVRSRLKPRSSGRCPPRWRPTWPLQSTRM